ncbi:hypothetical protein TRICI_002852 [Trichomonascus ciferrii]|uniref:Uncharacterized protein n=1 Tax=Trichomonascus ciferrii TaxID=44093 RepID=A0A642V5D4_9ASCO|nr:hypothetical protein TRICI_002852 [Trichomonascus ciferrii]
MVGLKTLLITLLGCTAYIASSTSEDEVSQDTAQPVKKGLVSPRKGDVSEERAAEEEGKVINTAFRNRDINDAMNKAAEVLEKDSNPAEVADMINGAVGSFSAFKRSSDYSTVDEMILNQMKQIDTKNAPKSVSEEVSPYVENIGQPLEEMSKTDTGAGEAKKGFARYGPVDKQMIATITNPESSYNSIELPTASSEQAGTNTQELSVETSPNRPRLRFTPYETPTIIGWPINDSNSTIANQTSFSLGNTSSFATAPTTTEFANSTSFQNATETGAAAAQTDTSAPSTSASATSPETATATGSAMKNTVGAIALLGGALALALI